MEGRGEQGRQLQINCAARRTGSRRGPRHAREQPRARDDARVGEGQSGLVQQSCASLCFRQRLPHALVRHEVQAHLARIGGAPPEELGARALGQEPYGGDPVDAQGRKDLVRVQARAAARALDVHVRLRAWRVARAEGQSGGRCGGDNRGEKSAARGEAQERTHSSSLGGHGEVARLYPFDTI